LIQKNQKIKSAATLLLPTGPFAANQVKPGQGPVAAGCRTWASASGNNPDSPAAALGHHRFT